MDTTEIRRATVEDLPAIAKVHVEADWDTYAPLFGAAAYRLEVAESELRWRRALHGDGLLLVASDHGAIVGLGHAVDDRIDALYLLSGYHRRRIGKAMLSRLLRFLNARGIAQAQLDVVAVKCQRHRLLSRPRRTPGGRPRQQGSPWRHTGLDFCRSDGQG
jgi:GNAT superfamily N-acetyltransferase